MTALACCVWSHGRCRTVQSWPRLRDPREVRGRGSKPPLHVYSLRCFGKCRKHKTPNGSGPGLRVIYGRYSKISVLPDRSTSGPKPSLLSELRRLGYQGADATFHLPPRSRRLKAAFNNKTRDSLFTPNRQPSCFPPLPCCRAMVAGMWLFSVSPVLCGLGV